MLALSNKMSIEKFKSTIKQNQNYDTFINNIKKRILNRKLISKIAIGKLKMATDEDMKIYYENNIQQFKKNKNSIHVVPFKEVKNKIFNIIMSQREQKYLKEYFKKLKLKADIKDEKLAKAILAHASEDDLDVATYKITEAFKETPLEYNRRVMKETYGEEAAKIAETYGAYWPGIEDAIKDGIIDPKLKVLKKNTQDKHEAVYGIYEKYSKVPKDFPKNP